MLRAEHVDTVIVCGCTTSGCVRATVVDALSAAFARSSPVRSLQIRLHHGVRGRNARSHCHGASEQARLARLWSDVGERCVAVEKLELFIQCDRLSQVRMHVGRRDSRTSDGRAAPPRSVRHHGCPAIGVFDVIAAALRGRGARGIAVVARYRRELTAGVAAGLRMEGFECQAERHCRRGPGSAARTAGRGGPRHRRHELSSARGARGDRGRHVAWRSRSRPQSLTGRCKCSAPRFQNPAKPRLAVLSRLRYFAQSPARRRLVATAGRGALLD
jgi:hypothetical protein